MSQPADSQHGSNSYRGLPVHRAQPDYLETIARLRGMQPVAAAGARVLELSCGVGQNLLPLADRYPEGRFVGIDDAADAIEIGRHVAGAAGLRNVELHRRNLLELNTGLGTFDYIIANAVYSWVDAPQRDKLLAICRDHLAPQGIAYVSYKTYPGWAAHDMFRNMMLYDSRGAANTAERVAGARAFLGFLSSSLNENEPYGAMLQGELSTLNRQTDDYLLRDHLNAVSHPVYFPDFVGHASAFSLQPAGDGVLGIRYRDYLGEDLERQLDAISEDDNERELYRDVVHNRAIRQTLLCHQAVPLQTSLSPKLLAGLYLEGALQPVNPQVDLRSNAVEQFSNRSGTRISTRLPLVKAALLHLSKAWPDYVRFEDCAATAGAQLEAIGYPMPIAAEEIARLETSLTQSCVGGVLDVHSDRPSYVARPSEKPTAGPLVRWQARHSEVVANRRHEPVRLEPFERGLLNLLDGTHDRATLIDLLATAVSQGELTVTDQQQPVHNSDDAKRALEVALPETLTRLARAALLVD